jgi:hypothetical protein
MKLGVLLKSLLLVASVSLAALRTAERDPKPVPEVAHHFGSLATSATFEEQQGLELQAHWSFQAIVRPPVPQVARAEWVKNPIDAFVAGQHQQLGLKPQGEASRLVLLRRLSFDLIGLPPTAEEVAAIQSDVRPDWYERAVTRLLDDPRHGERWARHWMDIWRYSDDWGLGDQLRNSQKHIWHWRDWMIESLNADTPFDEMVRLMLAADELHPNDLQKLRATGYLARNYFLFNRNQWMDETVEHVSKGFLGLTMNCAKCHDHKYDPMPQADYYRMRAFFEPYHVRVDMLAGEPNLARNGIPRVYDGLLDDPTYRFVRGDEKDPDKSAAVAPGIPQFLEFEPLVIQSLELPIEAWQPERRAWVLDAYRAEAGDKRRAAEAKLAAAREKLAMLGEPPTSDPIDNRTDAAAPAVMEARLEGQVAQRALQVAQAEEQSMNQRAAAMHATWERSDCENAEKAIPLAESEQELARAAARSERQLAVTRAHLAVAEAELRLHRAAADKREAVEKEVTAARDAVEKSLKQLEEPSDHYTKLAGAQWTPTRFFNSSKDDPDVSFPPRSSGRRTALARWITDPRNPLTARVAVNHLWTRHFGTPLVPTVFDFGRKGTPPTDPRLVDWLAAELIESGWSMKHMHRLMVLSATYRQSSPGTEAEENMAKDPDNTHFWCRAAVRLESQAVRDAILELSGTLDGTRGGPPVPAAAQDDSTRRSIYFFHSNNERNLFLTTFDEATVKECYRREQSIVPQQALALTNSRLALDAAPRIAARLTQELQSKTGSSIEDEAFIRLAFAVMLGAEPKDSEIAACMRAFNAWQQLTEAPSGDAAREFARANFVWVLLNHNDFL